jgi:two-component sensor histidine kinase
MVDAWEGSLDDWMPHGYCILWEPALIWLHATSDGLIGLAYYGLPLLLVYVLRQRPDLPFQGMFVLFGAFIVACGTTHLVGVLVLWVPAYWFDGCVKAATAGIAWATTALLVHVVPQTLNSALPTRAELAAVNRSLEAEVMERRRTEAELAAALRHQELLVREVHHRVKNNLQMVGSLLRLQSRYLTDPAVLEAFNAAVQRLQSIVLMHSVLDPAHGVDRVDCARYLGQVVTSLAQIYATGARAITLTVAATGVSLSPEAALPCGLIVHELVSNALKYAFPDQRRGAVTVTLARVGPDLTLTVADTGVGLPTTVQLDTATSLGFRLVRALAGQLDGVLRVTTSGGTRVQLTFAEAEAEKLTETTLCEPDRESPMKSRSSEVDKSRFSAAQDTLIYVDHCRPEFPAAGNLTNRNGSSGIPPIRSGLVADHIPLPMHV